MCRKFGRLLMTGALLIGFSDSALAATHFVRLDGTGDFLAIQPAIDLCADGDTVLVGPGTYIGASNRNLDFHGVDLVLCSEAGRDQTVIDCEYLGRGFYLHSGETSATTIEGFTIRNGRTSDSGAGVYCYGSSCTLRNARIEGCEAFYGAGLLFSLSTSASVQSTEIRANAATVEGGRLSLQMPPSH